MCDYVRLRNNLYKSLFCSSLSVTFGLDCSICCLLEGGSIFLLAVNITKPNLSVFVRLCNLPNCSQILRNLLCVSSRKVVKNQAKTKQAPTPPPPTPNKHTSSHVFLSCFSIFYIGILKSPLFGFVLLCTSKSCKYSCLN